MLKPSAETIVADPPFAQSPARRSEGARRDMAISLLKWPVAARLAVALGLSLVIWGATLAVIGGGG